MRYKLYPNSANDINDIIGTTLHNRGIENVDEYLHLDDSCVDDYSSLENINEAVECFSVHFERRDDICILCDTDPDGYTSAAMMYMYIKNLDPNYPISYVLHKNNKAHGIVKMGQGDFDIPSNTKLLIIPDAGTNDVLQLNELINNGTDCICLDHHEKEDSDIECKAIIVNNQISPNYKNKNFSGAGVVYEFLRALDDRYWSNNADDYLDLVALAQVSDIMDLRNFATRYYVNEGFKRIKNPMLSTMIEAQSFSMNSKVNPTSIAWNITPILNALIRIGSYEERELLFRAFIGNYEEFDYKKRSGEVVKENIYERVTRLCKNAKGRQDKQRDKLFAALEKKVNYDDKVIIIEADDSEPGIIGLSAMRLADNISRPVVVLRDIGNNTLSGSLRNYNNSPIEDLKALLNNTGLFHCQGHANAAGAEIKKEDLDAARNILNIELKDLVYDATYLCDFILSFDEMDIGFIKDISSYDWVWATGIKEPMVAVTNITVARQDIRIQGKDNNSIAFEHSNIKYVAFKLKEDNPLLAFANGWGNPEDEIAFDAVLKCGLNIYNGIVQCQCTIEDVTVVGYTEQND